MSESWSRLHRQNSVLNFIDAAFVTTEVNGGAGAGGVADVNPAATKAAPSAAKNQKAKGKESRSKVGGDEKRSKTTTKRNASSEEGYLEPSEADFPELPRLVPRAAHHADPESNGDSRRHGPPAMPTHIDRSFLLQGGTGTQTSDADAENDGKGELELELEDVPDNAFETECEDDDLLDDNVVFQSAFLRAYPSNEAFTTERNEWTSPTSGLLYPSSHANSSSRLDGLLFQDQDQRSTPSNREPYAPTNISAGFRLDLGLDLDLDLSRLVQDNHHDQQQHEHQGQGLNSLLLQSATSTHPQQSRSGSQDKLSSLFGADSLLGEFWNDAPSLPVLPQPHASFGHAFSTNFDPLSTNLGLSAGFGGLNTSSVGGGLGVGADSWSFGQLSAPHLRTLPPQSAPVLAAQPAYYFPPDSSTGAGAAGSGGAAGWSPPGLNPPLPPLLQTQLGLNDVATVSVSGVTGAPPPGLQPQQQQHGLQRPKVSAPPPGLG